MHLETVAGADGRRWFSLRVTDHGVGLPEGFDLAGAAGLGLSIVRSLVQSQLAGAIRLSSEGAGKGTVAEVTVSQVVPFHQSSVVLSLMPTRTPAMPTLSVAVPVTVIGWVVTTAAAAGDVIVVSGASSSGTSVVLL